MELLIFNPDNKQYYSEEFIKGFETGARRQFEADSAQRKGHWEYLYDGNYKCSNCGSWWAMEDEPCEEGLNFCPNCGADMRGE